jgi:hypothetical protein
MTKIIMVWWVITSAGEITEPVVWEGWMSMEACEIAAESFTAPNPKSRTHKYGIVASCQVVPK